MNTDRDQWSRIENPETFPGAYGNVVHHQVAFQIIRKDGLFNK